MRIFVYPKDVSVITGFSEGHSRKMIRKIKQEKGKEKNDKVTYEELAEALKLSPEEIIKALKL